MGSQSFALAAIILVCLWATVADTAAGDDAGVLCKVGLYTAVVLVISFAN